jgi:hypothetical protein
VIDLVLKACSQHVSLPSVQLFFGLFIKKPKKWNKQKTVFVLGHITIVTLFFFKEFSLVFSSHSGLSWVYLFILFSFSFFGPSPPVCKMCTMCFVFLFFEIQPVGSLFVEFRIIPRLKSRIDISDLSYVVLIKI